MTIRPSTPHRWRRAHAPLAAGLLAAGLLAAAACGDATAPRPPFEGQWVAVGSAQAGVTGTTIELDLVQEGNTLSGQGSLQLLVGAAGLTVTGTVAGSVVQLVMTSPDVDGGPLTFQSIVNPGANRMSGLLTHGETSTSREFVRTR